MQILLVVMLILATCATASRLNAADVSFSSYVDDEGSIRLPDDFRAKWSHMGSWIVTDTGAPGYGFHDVYTQRETIDAYRKTGEFPDGAVLVKEIRTVTSGNLTTGNAEWANEPVVWFVMIKDRKGRFAGHPNWGNGWGWALYKADDPKTNASSDFKADCIACHTPAMETDWVFIKGYPTLEPEIGPE